MATRFICTSSVPPKGFEAHQPQKRDLLRGTVVLLVESDEEGERFLSGLWDRFCGVLLVPGLTSDWVKKGQNAWKIHFQADQLEDVWTILDAWTASLVAGRESYSLNVVWEKEVTRLNREHTAVREHYHLVTEQLRGHVSQISQLNKSLHDQLERAVSAEAALSRSERDLAITLDSIGDAVVATDDRTRIRRMNPAAEELSGWTLATAIGTPLLSVFPFLELAERRPLSDPVSQIVAVGDSPGHLLLDRVFREIRLAPSASPIIDEDGSTVGYVFVFRDLTSQILMEEELRQRQRLDALGQLAGGVAHEFNNLLAGIHGYAELLEMSLQHDMSSQKQLKSIKTTVDRASGLTRQLLTFARKHTSQMKILDLHRLVRDVLDLAAHTFDRRISIETQLKASSSFILGEPALLQTVLLNLFINARDAMPEGGTLVVRTFNREGDQVPGCGSSDHGLVQLAVEDTGVGIPHDQLERVFEPFFTTKSPGKGTGLGLSALYGIMQEHKGHVRVSSQVGAGSVFTLSFPVSRQEPTGQNDGVDETNRPGRVLVVDDEEFIRHFLKIGLERHGYSVTLLNNGAECVTAISADPEGFDLVIMDINMPFMNGRDALGAIRPFAPLLPVILVSGYITEENMDDLKRLGAIAVLPKPFKIKDMLQKVAEFIRRSG